MQSPVNLGLISNPVNWVIVLLMVFIFGLGLSLVFPPAPINTGDI